MLYFILHTLDLLLYIIVLSVDKQAEEAMGYFGAVFNNDEDDEDQRYDFTDPQFSTFRDEYEDEDDEDAFMSDDGAYNEFEDEDMDGFT